MSSKFNPIKMFDIHILIKMKIIMSNKYLGCVDPQMFFDFVIN